MKKAREVLLLAASIAVGAPALAGWTAFGEDGRNAVWYVDPESVRTVGELRQVWAMKDMAQPVIDFDLSMQFLYEVDCQGRRQRLLEYQSFKGRMGGGQPTRGGMVFGDWAVAAPGTVGGRIISAACARS
ncbi:surface-adhesin E family protein [Azohydromonas aeria]|uniref:surface-adhesin E family protein n=1 Tax=Azohydromonas aeria TaxID=2590212 RepID=UPI0012F712FC|nr:surface-adhesin E family protein [Azohydromonas aeria]